MNLAIFSYKAPAYNDVNSSIRLVLSTILTIILTLTVYWSVAVFAEVLGATPIAFPGSPTLGGVEPLFLRIVIAIWGFMDSQRTDIGNERKLAMAMTIAAILSAMTTGVLNITHAGHILFIVNGALNSILIVLLISYGYVCIKRGFIS
jgi:hypothetical protein